MKKIMIFIAFTAVIRYQVTASAVPAGGYIRNRAPLVKTDFLELPWGP